MLTIHLHFPSAHPTSRRPASRGRKTLFLVILALTGLFSPYLQAANLNMYQDAFGLGMGGAVAAMAGGTQAIPYNPAGIARDLVPMIQGGVGLLPGPMDSQFTLGFLYPLNDGTVLGFSQYSDFPSGSSSTAYIGSFAFPLDASRDFLLGVNLKYLALGQDLSGSALNGRGLGFDMGLSYDLRNPKGTLASFALAIQNVDTQLRFDDDSEETMPRSFTLGACYQEIEDTRLEMDYLIYDQVLETTGQSDRLRIGAERFFQEKNLSFRLGYDGLFNSDGILSLGAGYHPAQPYEFDYALQIPVNGDSLAHTLNFIYRFETLSPEKTPGPATSQAEIDLSKPSTLETETPQEGRPVSGEPLRKLEIVIKPASFSPLGRQKAVTFTFPGDQSPDIKGWSLSLEDTSKKPIRSFSGTGPLPPFLGWEGLKEPLNSTAALALVLFDRIWL